MIESIDQLIKLIKENGGYKFTIKVCANSKINLISFEKDYIKIKITAQAIDGKANKALVEYLSKLTGYPKSKISILNGEKSSIKTIGIES